ncbi:MAG: TIGR00299 family protein, partial [Cyanobacteria bacterium PR.023]|nr:TIGR00299 family protein [Cyanobacteria bacterium PR.023]
MKIAYFDCSFGAAGDMLVAACLDAGASLTTLEEQLAGLHLPVGSYRLVQHAVNRCSLRATKFDVQLL